MASCDLGRPSLCRQRYNPACILGGWRVRGERHTIAAVRKHRLQYHVHNKHVRIYEAQLHKRAARAGQGVIRGVSVGEGEGRGEVGP